SGGGIGSRRGAPTPPNLASVVGALSVFADVETFDLDLLGNPETHGVLGDHEGDRRTDGGPGDGDSGREELGADLAADRVVGIARTAEARRHGERDADRADDAVNAVDAEHVSRVVEAELRLDVADEDVGTDRGHRAEHDRTEGTGEGSRRG